MNLRSLQRFFSLAVLGLVLASPVGSAHAAFLNIPANSMTLVEGTSGLSVNSGLLDANGNSGVYTAPVHIPAGQLVCRLILAARDNDAPFDITARLYRKILAAASGFGAAPDLMGQIASSSGVDSIRFFTDRTIGNRVIAANYIYWVELEFVGGFYQALAIRVEYKSTC